MTEQAFAWLDDGRYVELGDAPPQDEQGEMTIQWSASGSFTIALVP
jgi:hypothetical protein